MSGNRSGISFLLRAHIRHECYSWSCELVIGMVGTRDKRHQPMRLLNSRAVPAWAARPIVLRRVYKVQESLCASHFVYNLSLFHYLVHGSDGPLCITVPKHQPTLEFVWVNLFIPSICLSAKSKVKLINELYIIKASNVFSFINLC
jgi:hypothetical protein